METDLLFGRNEKGGCVKTLTQPFFMRKAQTFSSPGFVITQSFRIFRHKAFRYGKVTFSSLRSNQTVLFPQRIDENIAATDPVRIVNAVIDNLNLESFKKLYKETGPLSLSS